MIQRTFLDKTTTIKKGILENYGLHPISLIGYGVGVYRSLLHFDIDKIRQSYLDKTFADATKVTHHLTMKNCGSIDTLGFFTKQSSPDFIGVRERAVSFDVILFKVNKHWDEGVGFDNINDYWSTGKTVVSDKGATWYNATTEETWDDNGIYNDDYLLDAYYDYTSGSTDSIIVGTQHFDHGNENLDIDITDYVNGLINGEENYGLCLAFVPTLETEKKKMTQYVAFFNNKTNTIFEPVVESRYNVDIMDDRMDFYLNKDNKLYLYSYIGGELQNLDYLPTCTVEDIQYPVTQESKGVYSISIRLSNKEYQKDMILCDTWSNLSYQGNEIDDVELEFVTKSPYKYFSVSNVVSVPKVLNPIISGINDNEDLNKGEERVVKLHFKEPYTRSDFYLVDNAQYRIYVMDGEREVTIVDWDDINKMDKCNIFTIKSDELVPANYHVDIKAQFGGNVKIFKDELKFTVVSDTTEIRM